MPCLTNTIKIYGGTIKELQEKLETVESGQNPAISTPMPIPISNATATASTCTNWRDTYDSFGPSMLNPRNTGATAVDSNVKVAQTARTVRFSSLQSFGPTSVDQTATQRQVARCNNLCRTTYPFSRGTWK